MAIDDVILNSQILKSKTGDVFKALLELKDKNYIETVLLRHKSYYTACISSQVGCPLGCIFCATGQSGFIRNLSDIEIISQIVFWNDYARVKNVVFMGMGEPFLNWENVKSALQIINAENGLHIGQRHITISTSGIIDKIISFTREDTQINLAISLHSAIDQTRSRLMPVNKKYPLEKLIPACLDYVERTRRKLFFEYTLFEGINDTDEEIRLLVKLIKQHYLFHLNLIPYNATDGKFKPTGSKRRRQVIYYIDKHKVAYTVRKSFGSDIHAACGQLRGNFM